MGLREPLTRLLELMEEFGATTGLLPLNDERVAACYRELAAIVDAHPPAPPETEVEYTDPETGLTWKVKSTDKPGNAGRCRSCDALMLWVMRVPKAGGKAKPHPLNRDGVSHFATCPSAERWRSAGR